MKSIKTGLWFLLTLSILVLTSCNSEKSKEKKPNRPQPSVDAYIVEPTLLINNIAVSGSLLAFEEVELKNEVAGRIVKLNLPEGKFVKAGTLLVKIYDEDLQANLQKLKAELAIQEQILQRQTELFKVNGISQNDYDQTALQVSSIKAQIEVQKAQIRKTEILAPFDGIIGLRNVSMGAVVTTSTLLATIRMENKLKLDFSVPEKYGPKITTGMNVNFSIQGDSTLFKATVMATEREIDMATRNLKVRAVVEEHSETLIPGAYANVQLSLGENSNALMIPTQSIIPKERTKSVIVCKNNKAHFIEVKTGVRTTDSIEITEGIQPGDTIITTGIIFLKEGMGLKFATINKSKL